MSTVHKEERTTEHTLSRTTPWYADSMPERRYRVACQKDNQHDSP